MSTDAVKSVSSWRWWVTLAYLALLLVGTHLPPGSASVEETIRLTHHEKLTHSAAYFVLALLAFGWCRLGVNVKRAAPVLAVLAGLAAIDEVTQPWFGREADPYDWLADSAGILLGWLVVWSWRREVRGWNQTK